MTDCEWISMRVHGDPLKLDLYKYVAPIAVIFKYKKKIFGLQYKKLDYKTELNKNGYRTYHTTFFTPDYFIDYYDKDCRYSIEELEQAFKSGKVRLITVVLADMRDKSRLADTRDFYLDEKHYARCCYVTKDEEYILIKAHKKCKIV